MAKFNVTATITTLEFEHVTIEACCEHSAKEKVLAQARAGEFDFADDCSQDIGSVRVDEVTEWTRQQGS